MTANYCKCEHTDEAGTIPGEPCPIHPAPEQPSAEKSVLEITRHEDGRYLLGLITEDGGRWPVLSSPIPFEIRGAAPPETDLDVQNAMAYLRTVELACDARDDRQCVTYLGQIRALLHRLSRASQPPNECRDCDQLMTERDRAEAYADQLAEVISIYSGVDIGEHSSGNCPWEEAHEVMLERIARRASTNSEYEGVTTAKAGGSTIGSDIADGGVQIPAPCPPPPSALLQSDVNPLRDAISWLCGIKHRGDNEINLGLTIGYLQIILARLTATKSEPYCEACMGMHSPDDPVYHPELRRPAETEATPACTCGQHWASVAGHAGSCPMAKAGHSESEEASR